MNTTEGLPSPKFHEILRDFHFWIIIIISISILIIYYGWKDWFPWFWQFIILEYKYNTSGIFLLIPFLYGALVFWWRGSLVIWMLNMAAIFPRIIDYSVNAAGFTRNILILCAPVAIVMLIAMELKWRENQRQVLADRERERKIYMLQILKAQEDERQRIAQELHDDAIQELLLIANRAQKLVSGKIPVTPEAKAQAKWMKDATLRVSEEIRRIGRDLRPSILDNVGLVPAIRWLVERLNNESTLEGKVIITGDERSLNSESEVMVFRIVQEALNNAWKHSGATKVIITAQFYPESLKIAVEDNGKGFIQDKSISNLASEGKLGILGMQQRAQYLNGDLDIKPVLGKGTTVSLAIKF